MGQARRPSDPRLGTVEPLDASPEAARTAQALNLFLERVGRVLADQPVNRVRRTKGLKEATGLLVRNAGALPAEPPEPFARRYGVAGAALTEMPVERGIAKLLCLEDRFVGPMGADREGGYRARAAATQELIARFPFVYVHLKGPDEPGHDGDADRKRQVVEEIDRAYFGPFLEGLDLEGTRVAVTADHATPCELRGHSDDPVPWLLVGRGLVPRGAGGRRKFGAEAKGGAPAEPFPAREVLRRLLPSSGPASAR